MQNTVILALATMLVVVAIVLVFLLWRAYGRSAWRARVLAPGLRGLVQSASLPRKAAGGQPAFRATPAAMASGGEGLSGHAQRANLHAAGTATAALLHH